MHGLPKHSAESQRQSCAAGQRGKRQQRRTRGKAENSPVILLSTNKLNGLNWDRIDG